MDSSDEFFYHHFIETSSESSSDDDLLIAAAVLLWDAEQNALPKYRGSTRGRAVVNRDRAAGRLLLHDDYYKPAVKTPKMADKEHAQTSRKRVADKQINKDSPESDDDSPEQEAEIFDKTSEEVMATRRIVKVQRQQPLSTPTNPFSAIRFTPSASSVQASTPFSKPPPCDVTVTNVKGSCSSEKTNEGCNGSMKDEDSNADSNEAAEIQKDTPLFGLKTDGPSFPAFNNGGTNNNGSSVPDLTTDAEAPKKFAMTLKDMEKKGVTFACINSNGELPSGLTTFDLKFKDAGVREDFKAAVETHMARKASDA